MVSSSKLDSFIILKCQIFCPYRIVLDKSVIPKRYARVLLHAIYLDTVDLSLIRCGSNCDTSARSLHEVNIFKCFLVLLILTF